MELRKRTVAIGFLMTLGGGVWIGSQAQVQPPQLDLSGPRTLNPAAWPYPDRLEATTAAPGQHWLRYEDDPIRFLEVTYRPGEKGDAPHGHPYPSVFIYDSPFAKFTDTNFDPDASLPMRTANASALEGVRYPTCRTASPQPPHQPTNLDTVPLHFYRIEFKRIDGDGIKTNWATWYPWMTKSGTLAQWRASGGK